MHEDMEVSDDNELLQDLNGKISQEEVVDRKQLKQIDGKADKLKDMLAQIEEILHNKDKVSPEQLSDMLFEIEDCVQKTEEMGEEVEGLEANLDSQRQEWDEALGLANEMKKLAGIVKKDLAAQ